jgi:hypothetical protein
MADPQISQISQTQTTIPDYAKPYVEDLLGQAQAVTDVNQNPYMQYMGDRVAQYSPLQQMSFDNAALMQGSPQLQDATAGAGQAMLGALNTGYTYNPFQANAALAPQVQNYQMTQPGQVHIADFTQGTNAQDFMNPYTQNVVDIQKREAQRQSAIQGTQQQAQAAQAGAFGGGRDAVMRAERERNLGTQMNDIQAQGQNQAYQQAMNQFNTQNQLGLQAQQANQQMGFNTGSQNLNAMLGTQQFAAGQNLQAQLANQQAAQNAAQLNAQQGQFGAGLGLQGLQTALTGANNLANIGNTQYNQNMGINQLQNQYGTQQQGQAQQVLNNQYQDFLNYQNYPYKQMGFMSDMLRGLPLTQQSSTIYQPAPSMVSQAAGLGTAALGAAKMFGAEGGSTGDIEKRGAGLADLAIFQIGQE